MRHPQGPLAATLAGAALALLTLSGTPVQADDTTKIREALAKVLPDEKPTSVQPMAGNGLYKVEFGTRVTFMTDDGRYLIMNAQVIDLKTREDVAEAARGEARLRAIDDIGENQMIVFDAPRNDHTITVFTDIDCGYCRKLHDHIKGYGDEGIRVRYLFYPRTGTNSPSFDKAVSVWCADDRQAAMTAAKSGKKVDKRTCANPVKEHMDLGELMEIRGTPAIVLDNGDMIPGYVEPKRLSALLKQMDAN